MAENLDMRITATLDADPAIKNAQAAGKEIEKALEIQGDGTVTHMQENLRKTVALSKEQYETLKQTSVVLKENEKYTARKNELLEKQARLTELATDRERINSKIADQRLHIRDLQESGTNEGWIKYNQNKLAALYESLDKVNTEYAEVEKAANKASRAVQGFEKRGTTHQVVGTDFSSPEAEQALQAYLATCQQAKDITQEIFDAVKPGMADTISAFKDADAETKEFLNDFIAKAMDFNAQIKEMGDEAGNLREELFFSGDEVSLDVFEGIAREAQSWIDVLEKVNQEIFSFSSNLEKVSLTEDQLSYVSNILDQLTHNVRTAKDNFADLPQVINASGKSAEEASASYEQSINALENFRNLLASIDESDPNFSLVAPVDEKAIQLIERYKEALNSITPDATVPDTTAGLGNENEIASIIARMEELKQVIKEIETGEYQGQDAVERWVNAHVELNEAKARLQEYKDEVKAITENTEEAEKATKKWSISFKDLKTAFKNIKGIGDKAFKALKKQSNDLTKSLKHGARNILKYVLGFKTLFYLVRKLRTAVKDGLENLAQFHGGANEVNRAISSLNTSLLFAKNAWAAAFSPILTVVMPMITALINKIAELGNTLAQFFGILTGATKVFQAVKVDAGDYAKSLDKTGSSAGGAAKKTKELTDRLAAFDDLNVLGVDKDPNSSGSGGGGGAGNLDTPDIDDMFKQIVPKNSLADMIKEAWSEGDFTAVGEFIGEKIQEALGAIPWKSIQEYANKIGGSGGTFLNGLFGDPNTWASIGNTLAGIINTITAAIKGFFDAYKKGSVGAGLAETLRSALVGINWSDIGANVGEAAKTILSELSTALEKFPTDELFQALVDLLEGVDWAGVFTEVSRLLGDAVKFTAEFGAKLFEALAKIIEDTDPTELAEALESAFENMDVSGIGSAIGHLLVAAFQYVFKSGEFNAQLTYMALSGFTDVFINMVKDRSMWEATVIGECLNIGISIIKWIIDGIVSVIKKRGEIEAYLLVECLRIGKSIIDGIKEGIVSVITGIYNWLDANVIQPIVDAFCDLMGIHSPSTVFKAFGEDIINGLYNGITGLISKLTTCWTTIKTDATTAFTSLKDAVISIWNALKNGIRTPLNSIIGFVNGLIRAVVSGINSVITALNKISLELPDWIKYVPGVPSNLAGAKIGFNLAKISAPSIPYLAQGAVIPPNKEFLAMLGDQSSGTNIEAPLDTIKQAVAEELAAQIEVLTNGFSSVVNAINNKDLNIGDKAIGQANARYTAQQRLIRGTSI